MNQEHPNITNSDVQWTGDYVGLMPTLSGNSANAMQHASESDMSDLIRALEDPLRFVAAHVLLTKLSGVQYQTFPKWNGLTVEIDSDGQSHYDPQQRFDLARRWLSWTVDRHQYNEHLPE